MEAALYERTGNADPNICPFDAFATGTGTEPIFIAVGNDGQFAAFCRCIGTPELVEEARYQTAGQRSVNRDTHRR